MATRKKIRKQMQRVIDELANMLTDIINDDERCEYTPDDICMAHGRLAPCPFHQARELLERIDVAGGE